MAQQDVAPFADFETETNFDAPTTAILDTAYDRAIAELRDRGPNSIREAIVRRIITLASAGERDPDRLCEKALIAVGIFP